MQEVALRCPPCFIRNMLFMVVQRCSVGAVMPEEKDVDKKLYTAKKSGEKEDIYEGIESHYESERNEEREGGPTAPMEERSGPIILSPSTYVEEDKEFEEEKRAPAEELKKKYPPEKVPKDEFAAFRG